MNEKVLTVGRGINLLRKLLYIYFKPWLNLQITTNIIRNATDNKIMTTKLVPYIVENINIRRTRNKCNCKAFGSKSSSSANL